MKKPLSVSIDEDLIKKILSESKKDERSASYIVNKILAKHYGK